MTIEMDKLMKELDAAVGQNAADGSVSRYIDTGFPPLNKIMSGHYNGGLPMGRMVEVFGESSTGKTAMATQWMINAQKMGGVAIFIDWERSFDEDMAQNMGLNLERPYWFYFKPKTWEEGNVLATKVAKVMRERGGISKDAPIIAIFDSIASALPKSQADKEIDEYTMNDTTALARVTSTTLKAQAQHAEEFDATFVYLNQLRLKPGVMFGDPRCLRGDVMIPFTDGTSASIGDIVKNKISKEVWSFNEETQLFEAKQITDWHDNGSVKDTGKQFLHIRIATPDTGNGVSAITVTNDHKVLVDGKGWVDASEISVGDKLVSRSVNTFKGSALEFLKGVISCDASVKAIGKNRSTAQIRIRDNIDCEYAKWKVDMLKKHLSFAKYELKAGVGCRYDSEFTSELERIGKYSRDPLALFAGGITPMQLAIMIMDDGFYDTESGRNRYLLSVKRYKGNNEYLDALGDIFGKLGLTYSIRYGVGRIDFDKSSSRKIAEMICSFVHPSMERKLPDDLKGRFVEFELSDPVIEPVVILSEVVETRPAGKVLDTRMYDITVEGNHNFLAGNIRNGVVVHNCTPGGKAMEFYATVRLALGREKISETKDGSKEFVGQNVRIECVKSKMTKPFKKTELRLGFDDITGMAEFDMVHSMIEEAKDKGLLEASGAFITWLDGKKYNMKPLVEKIKSEGLEPQLKALFV